MEVFNSNTRGEQTKEITPTSFCATDQPRSIRATANESHNHSGQHAARAADALPTTG